MVDRKQIASNIEGTKGWCFVECGGLTDPIKIRARLQAMISLINEKYPEFWGKFSFSERVG